MGKADYPFLRGGGEMGELTRNFDWSKTSLGTPDTWPQNLRTAVSIILHSRFPMFLAWGPDYIQFYNDDYRPILGANGKHPDALGHPAREIWQELWPVIKPQFDQVMAGGEAIRQEDQQLSLYRNGHLETGNWTYSYSPVIGYSGDVEGVFVTCIETTHQILANQQSAENREQYAFAVEAAELGLWDLDPDTGKFTANDRLKVLFGVAQDEDVEVASAIAKAVVARDQQRVTDAIARAMDHNSGGGYDIEYAVLTPGTTVEKTIRAKGRGWFREDNTCYRFNGTLQDISAQVVARKALEASEIRFRGLIEEAPLAIGLFKGPELVIETCNDMFLRVIGRDHSVIGKPLLEAMPEMRDQPFPQLISGVLTTGKSLLVPGAPATILKDGELVTGYFDLTYKALRDDQDQIYGVLGIAVNVTEQFTAQQKLKENEAALDSILSTAPAAIGLLVGRDLIIENPNQAFIDLIGKDWEIVGKPLHVAMPELVGQPFLKILDDVYTTGVPFHASAAPAKVMKDGAMMSRYYNITYSPVYNADGEIYAVLDVGIDVTEQIEAGQQVEAARKALHSAIEMAELGTWSMDAATGEITYSHRLKGWLGIEGSMYNRNIASPRVHPDDRERVSAAIRQALDKSGDGRYDEIYTITHATTGASRIIHASGQAEYDETGEVTRLSGTAQDVTIQKDLQAALELEVQLRTEELASSNEALQATVEELAESNTQLLNSNNELAQYAYIASHDLQEPLRKIRVFTGMLAGHAALSEKIKPTVEKISSSAERMSLLIQDLLSFSRLLKSDTLMRPVRLTDTMRTVAEDFELTVQETGAIFEVAELPTIIAVGLQMNQLFYNLLSNALKFMAAGKTPHIQVSASLISHEAAGKFIRYPLKFATYYEIVFSDNGIGFDTQYNEQIFEVFKRLQGRDLYPGSGIGLALCRRIVGNHHGYLYAESALNKGSSFHIILPDRQHEATFERTENYEMPD